jgi:hypothetical protein
MGAPRIHAELRVEHGIQVGRKRVASVMKAAAISGIKPAPKEGPTINRNQHSAVSGYFLRLRSLRRRAALLHKPDAPRRAARSTKLTARAA